MNTNRDGLTPGQNVDFETLKRIERDQRFKSRNPSPKMEPEQQPLKRGRKPKKPTPEV